MSNDLGFDVLVLGGGAAGCVVAARLSADPHRRVCLVEAGPDYGSYPDGRWPPSLLDARVDGALAALAGEPAESHDWGFEGGPSSSRAKVIGGCSAHNGCEVLRGSPSDYDSWADALDDRSWSYEALSPYLAQAERAIRTRRSRLRDLAPIRRSILRAAAELQLPLLDDLNAPQSLVGAGTIPVNAVGELRWHAAFAYLDPVRSRPNLTIVAGALVDRILVKHGRAVGAVVRRDQRQERLLGDLVVLAAGAYGTPAILERTGIGDPERLRRLGIATVADLPSVGRGLLDHPYVLLRWRARPRLRATEERIPIRDRRLALSEIKWASPLARERSWDVSVGAWSGAVFDQRAHTPAGHVAGMAPCAMQSVSRGSVLIRSSDPEVLPAIDHGFLNDTREHDLRVLEAGVGLCREVSRTKSWRYWCDDEIEPGPHVIGRALRNWIRGTVAGTYHPCGTARMGRPQDSLAVTDSRGRVHGLDRLVIGDASLFPSIPSANIHISVLATAERIAAGISEA